MANGTEKLTRDWKKYAAQIFSEHPDWNAAQVHRQLIVILGEVKAPGISAIQKYMPALKKKWQDIQETGLDNSWHLGTLREHPLSAEAVHLCLKINKLLAKENKIIKPVTIREAEWIAQLYSYIEHNKTQWRKSWELSLWSAASVYAAYQILCDISNTDMDTRELDGALLQGRRQFVLYWASNPVINNAVMAALYQRKGLGTAAHYLEYLKGTEKDGEK